MATTEARMKQLTGAYADLNKSNMLVGEMAVPSDHVPIVRNGVNSWEDLLTSQSAGDIIALSETMTEQIDSFEQLVIDKVGINDSMSTLTQAYSGSKTQGLIDTLNTNLTSQLSQKASQLDLNTTNTNISNLQSNKADISFVNEKTQANNLAYKESFATLVALQTAYPSGDAYNHTVLADGYIYTWVNSTWTSTQISANGAGIADGTITDKKLKSLNYNNLFVKALSNNTTQNSNKPYGGIIFTETLTSTQNIKEITFYQTAITAYIWFYVFEVKADRLKLFSKQLFANVPVGEYTISCDVPVPSGNFVVGFGCNLANYPTGGNSSLAMPCYYTEAVDYRAAEIGTETLLTAYSTVTTIGAKIGILTSIKTILEITNDSTLGRQSRNSNYRLDNIARKSIVEPPKFVKYASNPIFEKTDSAWATANGYDLYFPCVLYVKPVLANPIGNFYMFYSSNHASDLGGIALATSDSPLGLWKEYGMVYRDPDAIGHVETPTVIFNENTNLFHLYYHTDTTGSRSQETYLATSPDGITWTKYGKVISVPEYEFTGNGECAYFRPFRVGNLWCGYHLMGGTNNAHFGISYSKDGLTWQTDPRPFSGLTDLTEDSVSRQVGLSESTPFMYKNNLWITLVTVAFESGSNSGAGVIYIAPYDNPRQFSQIFKAVDLGTTGQWDAVTLEYPWVIEFDNKLYMYYSGKNASGVNSFGVAICDLAMEVE